MIRIGKNASFFISPVISYMMTMTVVGKMERMDLSIHFRYLLNKLYGPEMNNIDMTIELKLG